MDKTRPNASEVPVLGAQLARPLTPEQLAATAGGIQLTFGCAGIVTGDVGADCNGSPTVSED